MTSDQKKGPLVSRSWSSSADSKRIKESDITTSSNKTSKANKTNPPDRVTPTFILSNDSCKVQTLTVSDQHATLLLTYDDDTKASSEDASASADGDTADGDTADTADTADTDATSDQKETVKPVLQSLLKLTVIPFHKKLLGSNPVSSPSDSQKPELKLLDHKPAASAKIATFLKDYVYKLKSESGAEYSYYSATPSSNALDNSNADETNDAESIPSPSAIFGAFDVELISPATERQIYRAMPSLGSTLIHETPDMYQKVVYPYIKAIVDGNSLGWINNVIEVKKEKERLIVNSPQFIVNIDTKWRSHPPPLSTPRKEWYGHQSVEDLYCLGIVKEKGIASLRDLTGEHIPMLKNMQKEGLEAIENIYGVKSDQIRCFVHYQPQFYHFHVHFTRLENEIGSTVERGHLMMDVIQNLEMDPMYYGKRTIAYKLKKLTPLHNLIESFLNICSEDGKK